MRKKKGFTLIELLVVIAIIAMLLAILMPALGKVKKLAMRLVCGTNVKGLGTAMNVYAFDYDDEFPKQGANGSPDWDESTNGFHNPNKNWANASGVTLNASLYMLVREADVSPKSFICPATDDQEFKMSEDKYLRDNDMVSDRELTDLWDFGKFSGGGWDGLGNAPDDGDDGIAHNSYSYQQVYKIGTHRAYAPDASGNAAKVVLGDRSPYCDPDLSFTTGDVPQEWSELVRKISSDFEISSSDAEVQIGNSANHDREGQNLLFNDGHAEFARRPDVGVNNDNVYTRKKVDADGNSTEPQTRLGQPPRPLPEEGWAANASDTLLLSDARCQDPQ